MYFLRITSFWNESHDYPSNRFVEMCNNYSSSKSCYWHALLRSIDLLEESFIRLPEWNLRSVKISLWSTWTLLRVKDQLLLLEPSCKSFHSTQCFETLHFFLILLLLNLEFVAPRGCKDRQENRHLFSRNICVIDHYIYHYIFSIEIFLRKRFLIYIYMCVCVCVCMCVCVYTHTYTHTHTHTFIWLLSIYFRYIMDI